jgi:hypothetical protein
VSSEGHPQQEPAVWARQRAPTAGVRGHCPAEDTLPTDRHKDPEQASAGHHSKRGRCKGLILSDDGRKLAVVRVGANSVFAQVGTSSPPRLD